MTVIILAILGRVWKALSVPALNSLILWSETSDTDARKANQNRDWYWDFKVGVISNCAPCRRTQRCMHTLSCCRKGSSGLHPDMLCISTLKYRVFFSWFLLSHASYNWFLSLKLLQIINFYVPTIWDYPHGLLFTSPFRIWHPHRANTLTLWDPRGDPLGFQIWFLLIQEVTITFGVTPLNYSPKVSMMYPFSWYDITVGYPEATIRGLL